MMFNIGPLQCWSMLTENSSTFDDDLSSSNKSKTIKTYSIWTTMLIIIIIIILMIIFLAFWHLFSPFFICCSSSLLLLVFHFVCDHQSHNNNEVIIMKTMTTTTKQKSQCRPMEHFCYFCRISANEQHQNCCYVGFDFPCQQNRMTRRMIENHDHQQRETTIPIGRLVDFNRTNVHDTFGRRFFLGTQILHLYYYKQEKNDRKSIIYYDDVNNNIVNCDSNMESSSSKTFDDCSLFLCLKTKTSDISWCLEKRQEVTLTSMPLSSTTMSLESSSSFSANEHHHRRKRSIINNNKSNHDQKKKLLYWLRLCYYVYLIGYRIVALASASSSSSSSAMASSSSSSSSSLSISPSSSSSLSSSSAHAQAQESITNHYFKVRPSDVYVIEGDSTELKCQINPDINDAGPVQWAKDGFLLGYEAIIPGHERYMMYVNQTTRTYNLHIHDVQLEDEAEFECQTSASSSNNNKHGSTVSDNNHLHIITNSLINKQPIRAAANLHLIIPPKLIYINSTRSFDNPNHHSLLSPSSSSSSSSSSTSFRAFPSNFSIESSYYSGNVSNNLASNNSLFIVEAHEGEKIIILCSVPYAKPPPRLKWYRKNIELLPEAAKTTVSKTLLSNRHTLYSVESSLVLYPKSDEEYRCQAEHSGLSKALRATAQINIFKKPSPPVIEGYKNGDIVSFQEKLTLKCTSINGYPPPSVVWLRNGIEVDRTFALVGRHEVVNTFSFLVDRNDNQAQYTCQVINSLTPIPLQQTITLNVFLFPTQIRINGPSEVLLETQGSPITLECNAHPASPAPNESKIRWLIDGNEVNFDGTNSVHGLSSSSASGNYVHMVKHDQQSWTVRSNLTFVINSKEPNIRNIACIDPPEMPILLGVKNGLATVVIGEIFKCKCVCYSGNPRAQLVWLNQNDREISSLQTSTGTGISNELVLRPTANDHGSVFRCHVLHPALAKPYEVSFTLQVIFPPEQLNITFPKFIKENDTIKIECTSSQSNPCPKITLLIDGKKMDEPASHQQNQNLDDNINDDNVLIENIPYNQMLMLDNMFSDQQDDFDVTQANYNKQKNINPIMSSHYIDFMGNGIGTYKQQHWKTLSESVLRRGIIYQTDCDDYYSGYSVAANAAADAALAVSSSNDEPYHHYYNRQNRFPTQTKNHSQIPSSIVPKALSTKTVFFVRARPDHDQSELTCIASNPLIPNHAIRVDKTLNVYYKPKFDDIVNYVELNEHESYHLSVAVRANPAVDNLMFSRVKETMPSSSSTAAALTQQNVSGGRIVSVAGNNQHYYQQQQQQQLYSPIDVQSGFDLNRIVDDDDDDDDGVHIIKRMIRSHHLRKFPNDHNRNVDQQSSKVSTSTLNDLIYHYDYDNISWFLEPIPKSWTWKMSNDNRTIMFDMNNVTTQDFGLYVARVSNTLGDSLLFIRLVVRTISAINSIKLVSSSSSNYLANNRSTIGIMDTIRQTYGDNIANNIVIEGDRYLRIQCEVSANPSINVKWTKQFFSKHVQQQYMKNHVTTTANNHLATYNKRYDQIQQQPMDDDGQMIMMASSANNFIIDQLQQTVLDSRESYIEWSRSNVTQTILANGPNNGANLIHSQLTISQVSYMDSGIYTCVTPNDSRTIQVKVIHRPRIISKPNLLKVAADVGTPFIKFVCSAVGLPKVNFNWTKVVHNEQENGDRQMVMLISDSNNANYMARNDDKFKVITRNGDEDIDKQNRQQSIQHYHSTSELIIRRVTENDYHTSFQCIAYNQLGFDQIEFHLVKKRFPETPSNLQAFNLTHQTAILTWDPGFDYGHEQTYKLQLWRISEQHQQKQIGDNADGLLDFGNEQDGTNQEPPARTFTNISSNYYLVGSLEPNTMYRASLSSQNLMGPSPKSAYLSFQTLSGQNFLNKPVYASADEQRLNGLIGNKIIGEDFLELTILLCLIALVTISFITTILIYWRKRKQQQQMSNNNNITQQQQQQLSQKTEDEKIVEHHATTTDSTRLMMMNHHQQANGQQQHRLTCETLSGKYSLSSAPDTTSTSYAVSQTDPSLTCTLDPNGSSNLQLQSLTQYSSALCNQTTNSTLSTASSYIIKDASEFISGCPITATVEDYATLDPIGHHLNYMDTSKDKTRMDTWNPNHHHHHHHHYLAISSPTASTIGENGSSSLLDNGHHHISSSDGTGHHHHSLYPYELTTTTTNSSSSSCIDAQNNCPIKTSTDLTNNNNNNNQYDTNKVQYVLSHQQITNVHLLPDTLETIDSTTSTSSSHLTSVGTDPTAAAVTGTYQISFATTPIQHYDTTGTSAGTNDITTPDKSNNNNNNLCATAMAALPMASFEMTPTGSYVSYSHPSHHHHHHHHTNVRPCTTNKVTFEPNLYQNDDDTVQQPSILKSSSTSPSIANKMKRVNLVGSSGDNIQIQTSTSSSLTPLNEEDDEV